MVVHVVIAAGVTDLLSGFGINTIAFLSQLVSFGVVFFLLWRWGLPAVTKMIDKRNAVIAEGVENAEKARKALEDAKKDAEQLLLDARRQGQEAIAQATKAAENEANRIQEEAQARARQIEQQQIERIQQEAARARAELNRLVVNLTINAASKVISKSVDSSDNRRLVEEFVASSSGSGNDGQAKEQ
ncbi:MAG TPA: F0F1 ATP synthase subunit B [Ktedonobacteraceae bacterium]|nr:F0F1 ATP synthase subunit B [Ktedonobacteraceae bacterium]